MLSLGIELSTQTVKLAVIDIRTGAIRFTGGFDYDTTFPEYCTSGGVLECSDPCLRHTSPNLITEAIDYAFNWLRGKGVSLSEIGAIKADGMQHCTVYADSSFKEKLESLNGSKSLVEQLCPSLTRQTCPIWEDRTPVDEAAWLTEAVKGKGGIEAITGNRAELRFPAAQVLRWAKESPEEYKETAHIMLLSAFVTSILAGKIAPVDTGDGWGTNLNSLDIENPGWSVDMISACDRYLQENGLPGGLRDRIGGICHYDTVIGTISRYFTERYVVNPEAVVLAGTGDNPATLLGCGTGAVISLGSSYTVNGVMEKIVPSPTGEYNVFGYTPGSAMALSVFTNGSKLHDHFLRKYVTGNPDTPIDLKHWNEYLRRAGVPVLKEDENLMLPYLLSESVPLAKEGIIRQGFTEDEEDANIRVLHVSQVLSLKLHSGHLGGTESLCVVGGASRNPVLKQLIADVFGTRVCSVEYADFAAPLGCAVSGARHLLNISYEEAQERFVKRDSSPMIEPAPSNEKVVPRLLERYRELEQINT